MSNPLALALRQSPTPDMMYRQSFQYFQAVCRLHPNANQRGITILAHDLPEALRGNRAMMGATMSGAVVAILDHETKCGILGDPPVNLHEQLDEIIIEQAAITGWALPTSDLVSSRVSEWERTDGRKYGRWLKALAKAGKIHRREQAAPLLDPALYDVKKLAVEQLRPVVTRLQERFARQRRKPTEKEVVEAFAKETEDHAVPFLNHEHNRELWLRFYREDPITHLHLSPERLFDAFTGFVGKHKPKEEPHNEYVRKKISSLRHHSK